jgi:integrase
VGCRWCRSTCAIRAIRRLTRNTHGAGTIRLRPDGLWEGRYTVGVNPGTGKQDQRLICGKSEDAVAKKLRKITNEIDEGTFLSLSKYTVKQWLKIYMNDYVGNVKPNTMYQRIK